MDKEKPGYYAIITAEVRYDKRLTQGAKLLYGEITALASHKGHCWASNAYFAKLYDVTTATISVWVSSLVDCGHVDRVIKYKDGTKEIECRYLSISGEGMKKNLNTPMKKNLKDSTTSLSNTINKDHASKIRDLLSFFSTINNFNQLNKKYWDVIRETRVTKKVAESVIYRIMKSWKKYDPIIVEHALKEHIANHKGKKEEYTLGIMRNTTVDEVKQKGNKSTSRKVARF